MAGELRWILLALSAVLLIGIIAWGARRSRRAPGNSQLRESTPPHAAAPSHAQTPSHAPTPSQSVAAAHDSASVDHTSMAARPAEEHGWGVPPFEPLSIRTADFEPVDLMDLPMSATAPPLGGDHIAETGELLSTRPRESAPVPGTRSPARAQGERGHSAGAPASPGALVPPPTVPEGSALSGQAGPGVQVGSTPSGRGGALPGVQVGSTPSGRPSVAPTVPVSSSLSGRPAPATAQAATLRSAAVISASTARPEPPATASESQRIVTIRVAAPSDALWGGSELMAALQKHGFGFGRYKVFHRKHVDGRTLFCAASLVEPGTFDVDKMPEQEFRGLTLFAVLPGPLNAMQAVDLLLETAGELAATLHGVVQDSDGVPLTEERVRALRDDVARFQASLLVT